MMPATVAGTVVDHSAETTLIIGTGDVGIEVGIEIGTLTISATIIAAIATASMILIAMDRGEMIAMDPGEIIVETFTAM